MATNNYFKVTRDVSVIDTDQRRVVRTSTLALFFFNSADELSIIDAYGRALVSSQQYYGQICMWQRPILRGPWNTVRVIGDRIGPASSWVREAA